MHINNEIQVLIITLSLTCFDVYCAIFMGERFCMLKTTVIFSVYVGLQLLYSYLRN